MRLQFAEGQLDRVEVGRIWRQVKQHRTGSFDRLLNTGNLMHREIVHRDDVAAFERWNKTSFHISKKHRPIHRTVKHERCSHPAQAQTGHKGDRFPMAVRRIADQPFAAGTAATKPHHLGVRAGFVDKHQFCGVKQALLAHPTAAGADHIGALLLRRIQSFF